MLDTRFVRENPEIVEKALKNRGSDLTLVDFLAIEKRRRELLSEVEELKAKRNAVSQEVARMKKAGEDAEVIILEMRQVGDQISVLDEELRGAEEKMEELLLDIPNVPSESVPIGRDEEDNLEIRKWGEIKSFDFKPQPHWDLGEALDILDFERGSKVTGARFTFYKGFGAKLERALISFMLDLHTEEHGYTEFFPPFIANKASMTGTGQLPKFAEDMFKIEGLDYYLIPTAEVPITNYHREEILAIEDLPRYYAAYSACFRAEAGSAGRDTRGLIRQHQFEKVEMVQIVHPETSMQALEDMTGQAEYILQQLGLPYRVIVLCGGDMGFGAVKTYDIEVWLPSQDTYREISSCSNCGDFQARRMQARVKDGKKTELVHTLNGSGLAVGRTLLAIMENYQNADGTITVPEVLRPYMGVDTIG